MNKKLDIKAGFLTYITFTFKKKKKSIKHRIYTLGQTLHFQLIRFNMLIIKTITLHPSFDETKTKVMFGKAHFDWVYAITFNPNKHFYTVVYSSNDIVMFIFIFLIALYWAFYLLSL